MDLPSPRAISGSFLEPNSRTTTTSTRIRCQGSSPFLNHTVDSPLSASRGPSRCSSPPMQYHPHHPGCRPGRATRFGPGTAPPGPGSHGCRRRPPPGAADPDRWPAPSRGAAWCGARCGDGVVPVNGRWQHRPVGATILTRSQPMPLIQVKQLAGRSTEQKREIVRELTDAYVRITGVKPESIWVTIDELPADNWATGGTLLADRTA
ncbi:4-oxalocrotonate tautomerase family protein [Streptomyces sp. NPDC092296]|uniref:tautomerase family protein n=1 Tax=Streptomyces sp. NPDC092296 TaxID=3366012 RepID=UPI00382865A5